MLLNIDSQLRVALDRIRLYPGKKLSNRQNTSHWMAELVIRCDIKEGQL